MSRHATVRDKKLAAETKELEQTKQELVDLQEGASEMIKHQKSTVRFVC